VPEEAALPHFSGKTAAGFIVSLQQVAALPAGKSHASDQQT
jgi:hypothetical protein